MIINITLYTNYNNDYQYYPRYKLLTGLPPPIQEPQAAMETIPIYVAPIQDTIVSYTIYHTGCQEK